jgi:outer membrane receptor for ferrienterochelin and colicins
MQTHRTVRLAVLLLVAWGGATVACTPIEGRGAESPDDDASDHHGTPDVDAARELDQQGVLAFREGRFSDAIRFFRWAYHLGGPSSELWNVARSRERMDDAETAAGVIEQYVSRGDLTDQDRDEAQRELQALHSRPSVLTVITAPPYAMVTVDGKLTAASPTPVSLDVRPGPHTVAVHRDGYRTLYRPFEARFGRAVILWLDLARAGANRR